MAMYSNAAMRVELVSIETNTTPLDGLWYEPEGRSSAGAALLFHGNTMNFYTGMLRFLPPYLTGIGLSCLAFNRRGHDIMAIRDSRSAEGAAFQTTAEGIEDNRLAARWLAHRGFPAPAVIGHSNGGMLAARHVADHPETPLLVLMSAHRGGTSMKHLAGKLGLMAQNRGDEIEKQAREMVLNGRGKDFILLPGWWYVATAESYLDRITTMPDTLKQAHKIACPVLYLRGDREDAEAYPAEAFTALCRGKAEVQIISECDHFYKNREDAVAGIVTSWIEERIREGHLPTYS